VVVFDLTSLKKISSIALSGKKPDAIFMILSQSMFLHLTAAATM
jgi:hypothetical protein